MDFFREWIKTRIKERGWPKSKGFFRKKILFSEAAILESMQDAVRIALVLGSGMPHVATSIVIHNVTSVAKPNGLSSPPSQQDIYDAIAHRAARGNQKLVKEPISDPRWLQFCLTEAWDKQGNVRILGLLAGERDLLDLNNPEDEDQMEGLIGMAYQNAQIALAWAIENPDDCVQLFHWSTQPSVGDPEIFLDATFIYNGWMDMAKRLVPLYESTGELQKLENLREK